MGIMCMIDLLLFNKKIDLIIHHILIINMIIYGYLYKGNNIEDQYIFVNILISCEISNIFLMINNILKIYNYNSNINNILFILTFIYYRIINYGNQIIFNKSNHKLLFYNSKTIYDTIFLVVTFYGFYILNIYWLCIIIKKLTPKVIKYFINLDNVAF
jgi:hypothetical protein